MGFNKRIVGDKEIELLLNNIDNIKFFLKSDVLFFQTEDSYIKFNKIKDDYYKTTNFK